MADGVLTPEQAASVAAVLEMRRKAFETMDLERRLSDLEAARSGWGKVT
jgi:hypothetical protein